MASSLLSLTLKKSTATTISTTLLTKLLRPKSPLTTSTATTSRRYVSSTGNIRRDISKDIPVDQQMEPEAWCVLNPLQTEGPKAAITIKTSKQNEEHKTVRVVMPGVDEKGYNVWVDQKENALCVEGNGEMELLGAEGETSGRTYAGKIKFDPEEVKVEKIVKSQMKHGILRITLSRNLAAAS
ncbi:hypothetical protein ACH5RR_038665 [Cinchona calisaya]|uniref:SHSP domain-containing protein n=1 Tax=Cinchona calisaya TaxID=153742 RepID=A0ABD2XVX8_9GENT